jgi:type IV pilus assembly protein PilA
MKKLLNRKNKGFTLIELMIVVAIIGILAAIAIPNFIRYQLRSKTAEARTNMGGIKTSQESFRSTEDNYANVTTASPGGVPGTTKTDWVITPCPATCNRTGTPTCTAFTCIGYEPAGLVYYQYESRHQVAAPAIPGEFSITAIADLDGDTNQGQFCLQSSNVVNNLNGVVPCTAAPSCGGNLSPSEVVDCAPGVY